jgi:hypothetical protein
MLGSFRRANSVVGAGLVLGALLLAGCSSTSTRSPASLPAVAVPSYSGPKVCGELARSVALRQLPAALAGLESNSEQAASRRVVASARSGLRTMAASAEAPLSTAITGVVDALAPLAQSQPNRENIQSVSAALETLASEGQTACSFGTS